MTRNMRDLQATAFYQAFITEFSNEPHTDLCQHFTVSDDNLSLKVLFQIRVKGQKGHLKVN